MIIDLIVKYPLLFLAALFFILTGIFSYIAAKRKEKGISGFRFWSFIFLVGVIVSVSKVYPSIEGTLGSLATIAAAALAGVAINENRLLRKLNRQDDLAREERDRKERLLNEIREWADKLNSKCCMIDTEANTINQPDDKFFKALFRIYLKYISELTSETPNIEYFKNISLYFSESLQQSINKTEKEIDILKNKITRDARSFGGFALKTEDKKGNITPETFEEIFTELDKIIATFRSQIKELSSEVAKAKLALLKQ